MLCFFPEKPADVYASCVTETKHSVSLDTITGPREIDFADRKNGETAEKHARQGKAENNLVLEEFAALYGV